MEDQEEFQFFFASRNLTYVCVWVGEEHEMDIKFTLANFAPSTDTENMNLLTRWWFQIFFIFTPTWGRFSF